MSKKSNPAKEPQAPAEEPKQEATGIDAGEPSGEQDGESPSPSPESAVESAGDGAAEDPETRPEPPIPEEGKVVLVAPKGVKGASHEGEQYEVDEDGFVSVPVEAAVALTAHGFLPAE